MSDKDYSEITRDLFSKLNPSNFIVQMLPAKVFVCGGPVSLDSTSLRNHIINHIDDNHDNLYGSIVIAENFKDYFKDGAYDNLLQFEEDIANISTLIVICLESAGSLVELGLFCNRKNIADKLLVYVPQEHTEKQDSFIYLGPLNSLSKENDLSVVSYPFPTSADTGHQDIELIVDDLIERLDNVQKTEKFDIENSGHIALLIHDIIAIAEPIKIGEVVDLIHHIGIAEVNEK